VRRAVSERGWRRLQRISGTTTHAIASYPSSATGWTVTLNEADAAWTIYAICSK
jgi:hypothetical protein